MSPGLTCRRLDLIFVSALLLAGAVPLLLLRGSPLPYRAEFLEIVVVVLILLEVVLALVRH